MKISAISKTQNILNHIRRAAAVASTIAGVTVATAKNTSLQDMYIHQESSISPKGSDILNLTNIPSSNINIAGHAIKARVVVDLNKNVLYLYDELGNPQKAYLVASGKQSTPTREGVKKIITIEKYPFNSSSKNTKRYRNPDVYGSRVIVLCPVDTITNTITKNDGQFIHGTDKPSSLGHHSSLGCVRMDNEAVINIANKVKEGQYVKFIR